MEREKKLEAVIAQFLKPIKGIPFEVVINGLCDVDVLKFDSGLLENAQLLTLLEKAMRNAALVVQQNPIVRPRPNEVGNDMEPYVISALNQQGLNAAAPRTASGRGKSTGYPDVRIDTQPTPIYLEVKTYAAANHETTQRSFYMSPADDPKVTTDAYHLLVGFEIERAGNHFSPVAFELVDLYGLDCDMKSEFNSDNRRLYEPERILSAVRL